MFIYFCVYLFFGIISLNKSDTEKYKKIVSILAGSCIILLLSLRHESMGIDLAYQTSTGYLGSFDSIGHMSWKQVLTTQQFLSYERGYIIYNKVVATIFHNRQFFLTITAILSVAPFMYLISKESDSPVFSYIVFLGMPFFHLMFSGLRQSIAIGLCVLALCCIMEKKPVKFVILTIVAYFFHSSAGIFLIAYPLYYAPVNKKIRIYTIPLVLIVFIFRVPLFNIFSKLFEDDAVVDNNGSMTLFIIFLFIYIFCMIFEKDKQDGGLLNIFLFACICQSFSGIYNIAMRVGYYFMVPIVLLLPKLLGKKDSSNKLNIVKIVVLICFVVYGLYSHYTSSAGLYPYIFFWKNI